MPPSRLVNTRSSSLSGALTRARRRASTAKVGRATVRYPESVLVHSCRMRHSPLGLPFRRTMVPLMGGSRRRRVEIEVTPAQGEGFTGANAGAEFDISDVEHPFIALRSAGVGRAPIETLPVFDMAVPPSKIESSE